ncbi:hypothetical protein BB559_002684 [Furculomyces boomerangus]|uniref:Mitochondrial import inner membrane translocase subunit TIM50 n=1 Tax=Furculomyces boomerangus TaxID=61424 RepID=A0A2T9YTF1_9FUNG|nr:hypothetical protein BB559_002684 [Furculomyces boomerangus]
MKLLKRYIEKDRSGNIKLLPEDAEDLWHIYNLIIKGDKIEASTIRGVKNESSTGSVSNERVRIRLTISVEEIFFDVQGGVLNIKGKNVVQNQYVQVGQYHTLDLELHQPFSIYKTEWDSISLKRVTDACDITKQADVAAIVMQEGLANVCLLTQYMTVVRQRIEVPIPRKRKGSATLHDKGMANFFEKVYTAIKTHVDFSVIKAIIVGSPGFVKDQFMEYLWATAIKTDEKKLLENRPKFIQIHTTSGHKGALEEILKDPTVKTKLANTKATAEVVSLDSFYEMMNKDPSRAYYGFKHVSKAAELGAVGTLMISDQLFRSPEPNKRRQYIKLVELVSKNRANVIIFSSLHVSGEQLNQLTVSKLHCAEPPSLAHKIDSYTVFPKNYSDEKKPSDQPINSQDQQELPTDNKVDKKASPNLSFGVGLSKSGLASKILSETTGIPNEDQKSSETPTAPEDGQSGKPMTAAEKRRARRMRANLPRTKEKSTSSKFATWGIIFGLSIGALGYFGQPYDKEETERGLVDNDGDNAVIQMFKRIYNRTKESSRFFIEPPSRKLLPDITDGSAPYTLVVALDDLLIKTTWDKEHGWRIAKRPYLDKFLSYMSSMYEVVIFSDQPSFTSDPILEKIDPYGYAPYRLSKEHTRYIDGRNVKDLEFLNRDLNKVILLDISPDQYTLQPENTINTPPFEANPNDDWLNRAIPFFEYLFMLEPKDVREVLKVYQGKNMVEEYSKWENDIVKSLRDEWEAKQEKKKEFESTIVGYISSILFGSGVGGSGNQPPVPQFIQNRENMRANFEIQHKKMIDIIKEERRKFDEEQQKAIKNSTVWDMAQAVVNQDTPSKAV